MAWIIEWCILDCIAPTCSVNCGRANGIEKHLFCCLRDSASECLSRSVALSSRSAQTRRPKRVRLICVGSQGTERKPHLCVVYLNFLFFSYVTLYVFV